MTDHEEETLALLRLSLCEGIGTVAVHRLVETFGSARAALQASDDLLRTAVGLQPAAVCSLRRGPDAQVVESELDLAERAGVRLVPFFSEDYPRPLLHLGTGAPPLLWIKGDYERRDQLAMAIVGSRRCSHYGRAQARRFAMALAGMGFTIVSGLAWGVDSEAHRAALQAGGRTIAVLGCGLGRLDSLPEAELALEIPSKGALISELPMNAPARAENFPPRNRLISGLSLGVVVAEASARSGTLITARHAGEQGKCVFAIPGNVDVPTSRGCHGLIRDGAVLVQDPRDVVESLGPLSEPLELPGMPEGAGESHGVGDARALALNERERHIYDLLGPSPLQIDAIITQAGLPAAVVSSTLLTLEIRGLVKQLPGQRYARA